MNVVYCTNGHYIATYNRTAGSWQDVLHIDIEESREDAPHRATFCGACGAKNLTACGHCESLIKPLTSRGGKPSYCAKCGKPFPWTENALASAKAFTDELEELNDEDKAQLKETFVDLAVDSPRTELAATRYKRILRKVTSGAGDILTKIIVQTASETAVKLLKP